MSRLSASAARVSVAETNVRLASLLSDLNRGTFSTAPRPELQPRIPLPTRPDFPIFPRPDFPFIPPPPPAPTAEPPPNIAALQYVNPGDVIRSADFNALVYTVRQLADRLGVKPQLGVTTVSVYPAFLPQHKDDGAEQPAWLHRGAAATAPAGGEAAGVIPVQLPDGMRVASLTVLGEKPAAVASFTVTLARARTTSAKVETVVVKDLNDAEPFGDPAEPTGNDEMVRVNNDKYSYFLEAQVKGAAAAKPTVRAIKIVLVG